MENLKVLNNQSEVEEFELSILMAENDFLKSRLEELASQTALEEEYDNKLYATISKHVGSIVTKDTIDSIKLPLSKYGEIYDEVFEKQDCLIRPSHHFFPYSLIRKKEELINFVPYQKAISGLQMLSDRSTSRAFEIVNEYSSASTYRAYFGDLVYIQAWLSAVGFSFFEPIAEKELIMFVVQHAEGLDRDIDEKLVDQGFKNKLGPHKLATIKRRIASLSVFLESVKWDNPCYSKSVNLLLSKLTKKYGGSKPAGKAITKDILDDMIDTCNDKLLDIRDRALLLFAWGSGGRRRTEVTNAEMKDLTKTAEGDFVYNIPQSKTDQEKKGNVVPVKGRVARALQIWLDASGVKDGAIFRTVAKGGKLRGALSGADVYRIVKRRLKIAGYDESQFGAHSLRSGFVTEAGRKGKQLGDVMQMTTHKSITTVMKYYQAGNISNNSASNLAD